MKKIYDALTRQSVMSKRDQKEKLIELDLSTRITSDLCQEYNTKQGITFISKECNQLLSHPVYI